MMRFVGSSSLINFIASFPWSSGPIPLRKASESGPFGAGSKLGNDIKSSCFPGETSRRATKVQGDDFNEDIMTTHRALFCWSLHG